MPKNRKMALESYLRKAGATTKSEQDELLGELGWGPLPSTGAIEVVRSVAGGAQILRGRYETSPRSELRILRERVILRHELEVREAGTEESAAEAGKSASARAVNRGGRNDA